MTSQARTNKARTAAQNAAKQRKPAKRPAPKPPVEMTEAEIKAAEIAAADASVAAAEAEVMASLGSLSDDLIELPPTVREPDVNKGAPRVGEGSYQGDQEIFDDDDVVTVIETAIPADYDAAAAADVAPAEPTIIHAVGAATQAAPEPVAAAEVPTLAREIHEAQIAPGIAAKRAIVQPLRRQSFELAEFRVQQFVCYPPAGVQITDVLKPDFWRFVAKDFNPFDEMTVQAEDNSYWAKLLILDATKTSANVLMQTYLDLSGSQLGGGFASVEMDGYLINWSGSQTKWRVQRISDNTVLKDNLDNVTAGRTYVTGLLQLEAMI